MMLISVVVELWQSQLPVEVLPTVLAGSTTRVETCCVSGIMSMYLCHAVTCVASGS